MKLSLDRRMELRAIYQKQFRELVVKMNENVGAIIYIKEKQLADEELNNNQGVSHGKPNNTSEEPS